MGSTEEEAGLMFGFQLRFELAVRRFFEIQLEPLTAFALRITGARTVFLEASSEKKDSFGIIGRAIQQGAKTFGGASEVSLPPERIANIEMVIGVRGIAV